jgi:1,2-diacylglycerol 3-beta-glucosyltransferase
MIFTVGAEAVLSLALALAGIVIAGLAVYLVVLAVAAHVPLGGRPVEAGRRKLLVIVPAHNEEQLIERCVRSLRQQSYPADLYRVLVLADNCEDATAEIAAQGGAEVLVRHDPAVPGKGQALRWGIDRVLSEPDPVEALVVVDADSIADRDLLRALAARLDRGSDVVQADYRPLASGGQSLAELAFTLFHRVRFSGRSVLGLPVALVGNGMMFTAAALRRQPWNAFSVTEDLEYSIRLRLAGIPVRFASDAIVWAPLGASARSTQTQRVRWEGGRVQVVRLYLPKLLARVFLRRDFGLFDALIDLAVPPLSLLLAASLAGLAISSVAALAGWAAPAAAIPWWIAVGCIGLFVLVGLHSVGQALVAVHALTELPGFMLRRARAYAQIWRGDQANRWVRTERAVESRPRGVETRSIVGGIPVDAVDMESAVTRILEYPSEGAAQVCTVNLDFLVRAQIDEDVRQIFNTTALNLADGEPIVWLSRLVGRPVPSRVAGSDLVPRLAEAASRRGLRIYLLGGEDGVAKEAAFRLCERYPDLIIAGYHEPPRASVEEMDSDAIVERVNASGADLLLVAFGHPKQERWIHRNRARLRVRAAIGVGCCFDLIAGSRRRAPVWVQRLAMEWLFRLAQEPKRLLSRYAIDAVWLIRLSLGALVERSSTKRSPSVS